MPDPGQPIRVIVIGGGCAAMTAAFELSRPEHGGRYQVTLYQVGWRLGGKGASGRGPSGRIEEHGLHLWMGWYENAFQLMRECYDELGRDPRSCPLAGWRDAFVPAPLTGVMERSPEGEWAPFLSALPPTEGLPGDGSARGQRFTVRDYMVRSAALLRTLFEAIWRDGGPSPARPASAPGAQAPAASLVVETVTRLLSYGELASLAGLVQAVALLEPMLGALGSYPQSLVLRLLDAVGASARQLLETRLARDPSLRRVWQVIDLTLATLRGEVRFSVMTDPRGFDAVDEYDCREWLLLNGASPSSVDSGFVRGLYDLGFSYEDGDPDRPSISAAQGLRSMVRAFFTYRGSFFWRMQAGMGDVVFAPLYEVLRRRGVRFEFFHRLENVRLAAARPDEPPHVEALEFDVQAEIAAGEYHPLVDLRGLPCWPAVPDWAQLVDGGRLATEGRDFESFWDRRSARRRTLRVTRDFDLVVLGVGLGAVPYVCRELVARDARWRAMVEHVKTVATQAFQVWLGADARALGWPEPTTAVSGFVEPFDTWADMTHLLPREDWHDAPRSLAYFCSVLAEPPVPLDRSDPRYPALQRAAVRHNAVRFLERDVVHLWPNAQVAPGEFRWDLLVDPREAADGASPAGSARFDTQFFVANVNPSDRYTLSLPGTTAYRISPLDGTYDNLTIAGDWTDCGFNAGCVEAAVMSGRLAAHAIARSPALEDIVGYDHP